MVFDSRYDSGFVFAAVVVGVGAEVLRNEPFLVTVEVADIWKVFRGVMFECFNG